MIYGASIASSFQCRFVFGRQDKLKHIGHFSELGQN